jgi:LysR family transcriptional regulator, hypochlorite-specific transcription factor HypT
MALEGLGIAFLPMSSVKRELKAKRLTSAAGEMAESLQQNLEMRAYRERPTDGSRRHKPGALALWDYLRAHPSIG